MGGVEIDQATVFGLGPRRVRVRGRKEGLSPLAALTREAIPHRFGDERPIGSSVLSNKTDHARVFFRRENAAGAKLVTHRGL
jgi:hypothetical protein